MESILCILEDITTRRFLPAHPPRHSRSVRQSEHLNTYHIPLEYSRTVPDCNKIEREQQLQHTPNPAMARVSGLHTTYNTSSTSTTKSPYLRLRPPSKATPDLIKSSTLPRFFCITQQSMLLISCLLFIICNSVPTVSCAKSPLTGMVSRSVSDSGPSLAALSGSPSSFSRRSEPESDSNNYFGTFTTDDSDPNQMKCVYYNRTQCENKKEGCGDKFQLCHPNDSNDRTASLCYALWRNTTDKGVVIEFKGCWLGHSKDCVSKEEPDTEGSMRECVQTQSPNRSRKGLFFCCCSGPKCNENVKHVPLPPEPVPTDQPRPEPFKNHLIFYLLLGLGILFLAAVVSVAIFLFGKCRRKPNSCDVPTTEPLLDGCTASRGIGYIGMNPIKLKEIRAQGKFGSVWQATDGRDNMVAVKVFAMQDRNSWQIEKDVFCLPQMKHNNILSYLGAERRGEGLDLQYWLITEYHPNGSLWDYLKSHTVNLKQLLTIIQGIGSGLTHLHEEVLPTATEAGKPSVAHRDFKSKNVLISSNFRACIADFGLAIVFHPNTICGDAHGQVGTRRYMAPEVLEGAINFNRDSFLRIDMYACGLVLWELMSRCCFGDITCAEYRLPFEDEVGTHPSLEDMQEVVSQHKKRPKLLEPWLKHPALTIVAQTVQDCWDQDAEARISASTICERINSLILNEDNCLSLNNGSASAHYRVPFPPSNPAPVIANNNTTQKSSFLMTAHPTGPFPNGTSNGSAFGMLRETST